MIKIITIFCWRTICLIFKHTKKNVKRFVKKEPRILLRDAMTGQTLGMTKRTHRRYIIALGSKDPQKIMQAYKEMRERREEIKSRKHTA